jgi:hypothetical protein
VRYNTYANRLNTDQSHVELKGRRIVLGLAESTAYSHCFKRACIEFENLVYEITRGCQSRTSKISMGPRGALWLRAGQRAPLPDAAALIVHSAHGATEGKDIQ